MTAEPVPTSPPGSWWQRTVFQEAGRERLGMGERIGSVIGIVFILFIFAVLIDIQMSGVGFFTDEFGPLEQVALYGSLLYGIFPGLIRAITASRNLGRLADIIGSVIFIIAASYLLVVYPFDVTKLVNYLTGPLSGVFFWLTNELARFIMQFAIVVSVFSAIYNTIMYLAVREELRGRRTSASWSGP
ncbi:MAG: hypothetical protein ISF22_01890 [Methanomassiliicoccus sp.]|nr:hypothetical protein [Methanomassiliicoccus sp.]